MSETVKFETLTRSITRSAAKGTKKKIDTVKLSMFIATLFYVSLALINYYILPIISNNPLTF